jgi:hypothetical protein
MMFWGCVKRFLPPTAAEYSSERHVILTISRSEIARMTCLSEHNLARSAVKILFTQPQKNILPPQAAKDFLHSPGGLLFGAELLDGVSEIAACRTKPLYV